MIAYHLYFEATFVSERVMGLQHDQMFTDFLDDISRCFIEHDFAMWDRRIIYPMSLITAQGPVILSSEPEARENFGLYLQACTIMRLDDIYRTPISLEDCKDGSFIGTYETNLLSRGARATAPYTSSVLLRIHDNRFCMKSIMNARGHHDWTGKQPYNVFPTPPSDTDH